MGSKDRAQLWRVCLGLLPMSLEPEKMMDVLRSRTEEYYALRQKEIPTEDKVKEDPLSAAQMAGASSRDDDIEDDWTAYHKSLELSEFIKGDLTRLYMNGVEEEYFQTEERQALLTNVLMLWCMLHKETSYRQGMHEVVAPILLVLEEELGDCSSHPLKDAITQEGALEATSFWMFEAIMQQIEPLYDPIPRKRGTEEITDIVHFCTLVQDSYLKEIDPALQLALTTQGIYPQIYGMRWARLLFGREFAMTHTSALYLWDFLFAHVYQGSAEGKGVGGSMGAMWGLEEVELLAPRLKKKAGDGSSKCGCVSDYSVLMNVCGDLMIAMLVHQREQLLSSDESECLGLLMHYPPVDVTDVLKLAFQVQKGTYEPSSSYASSSSSSSSSSAAAVAGPSSEQKAPAVPSATRPNWLASSTSSSRDRADAVYASVFTRGDLASSNTESNHVTFTEKAGANLSRGLTSIEQSLHRVSGALKQTGVISPTMAKVEELGSSLLHSAMRPAAAPSDKTQSQSRSIEDALFGSEPFSEPTSEHEQVSADLTDALLATAITSPTTASLSQSAPPLATPAKQRAAVVRPDLASNGQIGDRLLSIADELGQRHKSHQGEMTARETAAVKLRLLAALLDGNPSATLDQYDHVCVRAARGEEISELTLVESEHVEEATTTGDGSHEASMEPYEAQPSREKREKEEEEEKEKEKEEKEKHSTDLSFLEEEDFDGDDLFKPAAKAKKKHSAAADEAFALLLGD